MFLSLSHGSRVALAGYQAPVQGCYDCDRTLANRGRNTVGTILGRSSQPIVVPPSMGACTTNLGNLSCRRASVDGDTLRWTVTLSRPIAVTITCQALRQGDSLNGQRNAAAFGNFTFTGRRETV